MRNLIIFIKNLIKKYFVDTFFLNLPQLTRIIISLVTLPIILTNLPMKNYGELQFVLALQVWLISLSGGNITSGAKRGIAQGLEGTFLFAFFNRLKLLIPLGVLALLSCLVVYNSGLTSLGLLLVLAIIFVFLGYLPKISYSEFFIAKKEFKNYGFWQTISSVLVPIVSAGTAVLTHNILIFTLTQFASDALIALIAFFRVIIKNKLYLAYKEKKIDKNCFVYGIKLIPASLAMVTSSKLTSFIIGPFFGFANLAVFSIAYGLQEKSRTFMKSLHNLFYADFARREEKELTKKIKTELKKGIIISFFFALGTLFAGYFYVSLFLPASYQMAKIYFLILILALPATILGIIMHTILSANLRYKEITILSIFPNIVQMALILFLGFSVGVIGICWALVLGEWIYFGFCYFLTIKKDFTLKWAPKSPVYKKLSKF